MLIMKLESEPVLHHSALNTNNRLYTNHLKGSNEGVRAFMAAFTHSDSMVAPESFQSEDSNNLFAEKSIVDCQLPELIVCYKESACDNIIKDISMDEAVPPQKLKIETSTLEDSNPSLELQPSLEDSTQIGSLIDHYVIDLILDDIIKLLMQELDEEMTSSSPSIQIINKENRAKVDSISVAEELKQSSTIYYLSYNSKVESGSITFDFNSLESKTRTKTETSENGMVPECVEDRADMDSSGPTASGREDDDNKCQENNENLNNLPKLKDWFFSEAGNRVGEASFSSASFINLAVPVTHSGSLSVRSDSSNASSCRSFAFPILPTEWSSSPVRMAKVDRRRIWNWNWNRNRKYRRCWGQSLLCCRF